MINIDTRLLDRLDINETWLMLHLAKYFNQNNRCWPSNAKLLEATGWSEKTLWRVKKSLIEKDLLNVEQRYREDGSKSTNTYTFKTDMIGVYVKGTELKEDVIHTDTTLEILPCATPQILPCVPRQESNDIEVLVREVLTNEQSLVVLSNDVVVKKKKRPKIAIDRELQEKVNEVIGYLNAKTKKDYRPTTPDYIKHIKSRFDDGYTMEDFKAVIDVKCEEWLNTPRRIYLRPNTLFIAGHFEDYRVQSTFEFNALPDPSAPHYQLCLHIQNTYPNLWSSNVRIFNAAEYADYQNNVTLKGMALQATENKRKALAAIMAKLNEDYKLRQSYNSLFDAYIALAKTYLP
jgi:uncharacterized phage protein (TIGR02220 family)